MLANLQRVYGQAFKSAQSIAKLAERAYRVERNDESTLIIGASYWKARYGGLVPGEELMADLLEIERRFIEINYRMSEVDQSFSILQLSPDALLTLRETGECEATIPEIAFDLHYPGHYRRRIRAVRLTIPCATDRYSNVAATVTLQRSYIRRQPQPGEARLGEVPLRKIPSVATSSAQDDAGLFEFSFRNERCMPFEGAGAVSTWKIALPKSFRPFDYRTITDVIIHLSYTVLTDNVFRQHVEETNAAWKAASATR